MMLFIRMANPLYIQILKNGPFTSMIRVEELLDGDMVILAHYAPKDTFEYSEPEKEKVSLDSGLQLILIKTLDNVIYNNFVNCDTDKQIWEKIEILCEETEEVRSNQRRILISQYEGFMAKPKESITEVFERFNKLINDLQPHDKYYGAEEMNLKFFLTLSDHLEQKISAIREGRDLSRITLEVLYGILKTYELEKIQRKSLRSGQGHVVDGSSALIVNESQISTDEPRSQTPVASTSEQRINDSQEQVILELEKDEFYTLDVLDELAQSMAYLARKFSNIRVKRPRFFKGKGQSFNKDSNWKGKGKITKKAKKNKAYLEFEAKYEALLKKQQSKAYIAAGPTLTTIDLNVNQYKEAVEKMNTEMFHIHTSMFAANEEVSRLTKIKEKLETVLREKLEKNEVKLKYFRNKSELVGQYHEKNKPCANIAIGFDYDALNDKKKIVGDKGKAKKIENAPTFLKEVNAPIFKACEINFSEEELIIKQEIADEDKKKKTAESTQSSNTEEKLMEKKSPQTPIKETKTEDARKKKKNRNGKIGINKSNNFAYVADAPRKKCEKYGSVNHLTHLCKKAVSKLTEGACKYSEANKSDPYSFYDKFDCIPCNLKVMKNYHKLRVDLKETKIGSTTERENAQQSMNSILSETTHSTSAKSVNKKKVPNTAWFEEKVGPFVTFRDNNKGFTMGYGKIVSENIVIDDVALVASVEVNLLSVSQFADKGFKVLFNKEECTFISKKTGEVAQKGASKRKLVCCRF
ncbi:hypothetical protein AgCh_013373 [Apium graveolens]